eukprot:CAMPEP_0175070998 /NCGR_PEP_ID=MMETSP0052_2-20121109/19005_1 /TAXON_ID=51329 ORGANISM="Polytomella parva, Strain SAG 63-3" /NCGR_SAMPLE_ID=MMETSP0052_2 /ASSEMBLY_ACC=CAM_ASM_000194 /LENGTH=976 /DNA_ID=CAMNT_0016338133 /DNA_START=143 /DNA_END=3070 /DNA_ORIENTATION=+
MNLNESDSIKVAIRIRPLSNAETQKGATNILSVTDPITLKVCVPGPGGTTMERDFRFHACLGPSIGQEQLLSLCGITQLLDAALQGYNVTIFAYGQTGSGKTYTMSGKEEVISSTAYRGDPTHDGIVSRAVNYLYSATAKRKDYKFSLSATYLEIYNEGVYDLLTERGSSSNNNYTNTGGGGSFSGPNIRPSLPVKWDPLIGGFFVPGLKSVQCPDMSTMMDVVRSGMAHRRVGSHELNIESSRSHTIITVSVQCTSLDPTSADFGTPRLGKVSFVDLAGSERLKDSRSEGTMLKETANINKSLFMLGKVISALAEREGSSTLSGNSVMSGGLDSMGIYSNNSGNNINNLSNLNNPNNPNNPNSNSSNLINYLKDPQGGGGGGSGSGNGGGSGGSTNIHIPYRESKLTKLLMDCLGGTSMALMIACCSPSASALEETLSTLTYASRAKNIHNRPCVQYDPRDAQVALLRKEIDLLRQENVYLRDMLRIPRNAPVMGGVGPSALLPGSSTTNGTPRMLGVQGMLSSYPGGGGGGGERGGQGRISSMGEYNAANGAEAGRLSPSPSVDNLGAGYHGVEGRPLTGSSFPGLSGNSLLGSAYNFMDREALAASVMSQSGANAGGCNANGSGTFSHRVLSINANGLLSSGGGGSAGMGALSVGGSLNLASSINSDMDSSTSSSLLYSKNNGVPLHRPPTGTLAPIDGSITQRLSFNSSIASASNSTSASIAPSLQTTPENLHRRLQETQQLLSRFSEENGRLARENERLRAGKAVMGVEYSDVLEEIEQLRGKLSEVESGLLEGIQTPITARAMLESMRKEKSNLQNLHSQLNTPSSSQMQSPHIGGGRGGGLDEWGGGGEGGDGEDGGAKRSKADQSLMRGDANPFEAYSDDPGAFVLSTSPGFNDPPMFPSDLAAARSSTVDAPPSSLSMDAADNDDAWRYDVLSAARNSDSFLSKSSYSRTHTPGTGTGSSAKINSPV